MSTNGEAFMLNLSRQRSHTSPLRKSAPRIWASRANLHPYTNIPPLAQQDNSPEGPCRSCSFVSSLQARDGHAVGGKVCRPWGRDVLGECLQGRLASCGVLTNEADKRNHCEAGREKGGGAGSVKARGDVCTIERGSIRNFFCRCATSGDVLGMLATRKQPPKQHKCRPYVPRWALPAWQHLSDRCQP